MIYKVTSEQLFWYARVFPNYVVHRVISELLVLSSPVEPKP